MYNESFGDSETLARHLAEGSALFTLLGRVLYGVPDRELFSHLADDRVFEEVPFLESGRYEEAQGLLLAWTDACDVPFSEEDYHDLSAEYTRLFAGVRKVLAPPWESVYFNKERMVFQRQTFEVRALYAKYGLEVSDLSHEPDDHLAYELMFTGYLMKQAEEQIHLKDYESARRILADAVSFVVCHPLGWIDRWHAAVKRESSLNFYLGYASLVEAAFGQVEHDYSVFCAS